MSPSAVLHCVSTGKGQVAVTVSWVSAGADVVDVYTPTGVFDGPLAKSGSKSYTIACDGTPKTFRVLARKLNVGGPGPTYETVAEALTKSSGTVPTITTPTTTKSTVSTT